MSFMDIIVCSQCSGHYVVDWANSETDGFMTFSVCPICGVTFSINLDGVDIPDSVSDTSIEEDSSLPALEDHSGDSAVSKGTLVECSNGCGYFDSDLSDFCPFCDAPHSESVVDGLDNYECENCGFFGDITELSDLYGGGLCPQCGCEIQSWETL